MNIFRLAACTLVFALVPAMAWSAQVVLTPAKDNTIFQDNSSNSGGGEIGIFVGANNAAGPPPRRGLIQFDVAGGVPAGVTITDATLTLYLEMANNATGRTVSLQRLNVDWGEGTAGAGQLSGAGFAAGTGDATWTESKHSQSTWTAGGDFVATASASQTISGTTVGAPFTWNSAGLTSDVADWYANNSNNHGWDLVNGAEGTTQSVKTFYSKEFSNSAVWPTLTITYVPEPTTAVLAILASTIGLFYRRR